MGLSTIANVSQGRLLNQREENLINFFLIIINII